jgi:hypothetical protein
MLDVMGLLERAKADRERAAQIRVNAARFTGLCDRLQAREAAVALDRRAAVLVEMATVQMAALSR